MKATTAEQRKAWAEVHKALTNYIVNYGPIEVKKENKEAEIVLFLDDLIYYPQTGTIFCPDYRFSRKHLDKPKIPWYNRFRK